MLRKANVIVFRVPGGDVNQPAEHGELPLHLAAGSGSMDTVRTLLMRRSLINSRCLDGWTPLHWATRYQHTQIVKVRVDNMLVEMTFEVSNTERQRQGCDDACDIVIENNGAAAKWAVTPF